MNQPMKVIARIRQLKNDRGWTDYRLASEAMIPQSTLASMYERITPPKLDILENICHAFGITLAQFFQEDELTEIVSEDEKQLLESYRKLSSAKKKAPLDLIGTE